ncbi:hypothetical protein [endosymbiont 'TC1' of Trimyema compressum]|uniref:hypothetical protein n=1 Tax=endosymbiont 'TC1' of Trimyema compressum TaxID=243899 RepID=UPI00316ADAB0
MPDKGNIYAPFVLAHRPELLIMDEPTVGIDPQSRNHILKSVMNLREQGITIIYTTHYMDKVEKIASRIIIMDKGKIIASGTKEEIEENINKEKIIYIKGSNMNILKTNKLLTIKGIRKIKLRNNILQIFSDKHVENLNQIIPVLIAQGCKIYDISAQAPSLEAVFLSLTGRSLRD